MKITVDQVAALVPDAAVLADGRKLAASKSWKGTARSARAAWGECQGSALYQVRADLCDLATKCSCPSRKFPCKHGVALLLLVADRPLADEAEPSWVSEWLAKRAEMQSKRGETRDRPEVAPDPDAAAKRAAKRHERVLAGLDALDLWMEDLLRGGFASMPRERPSVFEAQAARLVDAQAPGLASRLREIDPFRFTGTVVDEALVGSVLGGLGKVALLSHAYRRVDSLGDALAADVRTAIGWTTELDEVAASGPRVLDQWVVLGSVIDDDERVKSQRTWIRGLSSGRDAMVLQFAAGSAGFGETFVPATRFAAEVAYWPSAFPQRALVRGERGAPESFGGRVQGHAKFADFLDVHASALARQPWLDRMACSLHDVTIGSPPRWLADRDGRRVELQAHPVWDILARSGGRPVDAVGEWGGASLRPLLWRIDGSFVLSESVR